MVWLLIVVLAAFVALVIGSRRRLWRVFGATPVLRICAMALFSASMFVALTAILGGITVAIGIDKFPAAWLVGTPFRSFLIPGLILAVVVGGSALVAGIAALRRSVVRALASIVAGAILLGWLGGERVILPSAALPRFSWLEAIYVAAGVLMFGPGLVVWWIERRHRLASGPAGS